MKRILASLVVVVTLLAGLAAPAPVRAQVGFIRLDGQGWSQPSVGTWDPVTRTATLQFDLVDWYIEIAADGITLDGNGHTLTAAEANWAAVRIGARSGVTVRNVTARGNYTWGILFQGSGSTLTGNQFIDVKGGIACEGANDALISGNTVQTVPNAAYGMYIHNCTHLTLRDNAMSNSILNFGVDGTSPEFYDHDIDTSNLADGKRIYYIRNASGQVFDGVADAGTVYLVNCSDMTVANLALTHNMDGVCLVNTHDSRVESIETQMTGYGVRLVSSDRNVIDGNTATDIFGGLRLDGATGNVLSGNTVLGGSIGVAISGGGGNTVRECTITGNTYYGLQLQETADNRVYGNYLLSNAVQASVEGGSGNVFNLDASAGGGNYWSDWTGPDTDNDGFVDSPYVFAGGQDDLPLYLPALPDTLAPRTDLAQSGVGSLYGWWHTDVQIELMAVDWGGSGVASTEYHFDGTTWTVYDGPFSVTDEGTTTVYYRSTDNVGNVEETKSVAVKIDKTLPVVTRGAVQGVAGNSGWYLSDVSIPYTASDALSGLVDPADASFVLTASGEGKGIMAGDEYWSQFIRDRAGNEVWVQPKYFDIDKTAPVLTQGAVEGVAGKDGWYRSDVTVAFSAADAVSGLANAADASFALTASGEGEAVATDAREVSDVAGRAAVAGPLTFKIDMTPPVLIGTPTTEPNAAGWYNHEVTIYWTASDALSGLDPSWPVPVYEVIGCPVPGPIVISSVVALDLAGNEAAGVRPPIHIDCAAPAIAITTPQPGAVLPVGTALEFSAADDVSGLTTLTATLDDGSGPVPVVSGDTPGAGVYTLVVQATDRADNVATETRSFVVYDPNGGSLSGKGWIDSPAGAYLPAPALTGKASFDFDAGYESGAAAPTGQAAFELKSAGVSFSSTSYAWLAVAGAKAQCEGVGTIDGEGSYGFLLTVVDGKPDCLRIKIWDEASGTVVYDNQPGAGENADPDMAIGGGSIAIRQS